MSHKAVLQCSFRSPNTRVLQAVGPSGVFSVSRPIPGFGTQGEKLAPPVQQRMEQFFGADFSDVRVHVGPQAASIGALAFTHGSDIYFAPGQYQPTAPRGEQLLGHELTHVVQQRAGRVRNPLRHGLAVVQDKALEDEADRRARRLATFRTPVQAKVDPTALPTNLWLTTAHHGAARAKPASTASRPLAARVHTAKIRSAPDSRPHLRSKGAAQRMRMSYAGYSELDEALRDEGYASSDLAEDDNLSDSSDEEYRSHRRRKREHGNSRKLGRSRFKRSTKKKKIGKWWENREAQHLIPASLCDTYPCLKDIIDDKRNGMMLPKYKRRGKKLGHRKGPGVFHHNVYSNNVKKLIEAVLDKNRGGLKENKGTMFKIMDVLRIVNKPGRQKKGINTIDDIPYSTFEDVWNRKNPKHAI